MKWEFIALDGFVDLHCHALYRVDDGAQDEQIMQNMLDMAYNDGTRYLCFTPHFKIYEFNEDNEMYEQVERMKRRFSDALAFAREKHPDGLSEGFDAVCRFYPSGREKRRLAFRRSRRCGRVAAGARR